VEELRFPVKRFRPTLLFLSKTKMGDAKVKGFMWSLGYTSCYAISCEGRSGGLALFLRIPVVVSLRVFKSHCIDVCVTVEESAPWRATFVYGEPKRERRYVFWDLLRRLRREWQDPWIWCGYFNEVLCQDEHFGSKDRSDAQIELFQNYLKDHNLLDMGFSGPKFTWTNR
jgi:hypothetical protein